MKRDLSRIPDPKAPDFTYRDERSTPVAEEFKEARRAKRRKQLPQLPLDEDEPIPYVLTEKAEQALVDIDSIDREADRQIDHERETVIYDDEWPRPWSD